MFSMLMKNFSRAFNVNSETDRECQIMMLSQINEGNLVLIDKILLRSRILSDAHSQLSNILVLKNKEIEKFSRKNSRKASASNLEEDISFLLNNEWISDSILNACLKNMIPIRHDVLCLDSNVSFLIKHLDNNDINEFLHFLNLTNYNFLTLFVSDCGKYQSHNPQTVNGSHWSLLVVDLSNSICYHFDSLGSAINYKHAKKIINNLSKYLRVEILFVTSGTYFQENDFDCGIETLGNLNQVLHHFCLGLNVKTLILVKNDTILIRKNVLDFLICLKYGKSKRPNKIFSKYLLSDTDVHAELGSSDVERTKMSLAVLAKSNN